MKNINNLKSVIVGETLFHFDEEDLINGEFVIPKGVTKIKRITFINKDKLKKIVLNDEMKIIEPRTFNGTTGLEEADLNQVQAIGEDAFMGCKNLRKINLGESLLFIGHSAFSGCSDLKEITLPESLKIIYGNAFDGCVALESITIPKNVKQINAEAFKNCINLTDLNLREVEIIEAAAFKNCRQLKEIILPRNIEKIGEFAFSNCDSLRSVKFGNNVKNMEWGVFFECLSLKEVILPESLEEIKDATFCHCGSLQNITFPKNLKHIHLNSFAYCNSLKNIKLPNGLQSIGKRAFIDCWNLESIEIPDSVSELGGEVFQGCVNLKEVTLSNNLVSIGGSVFRQCRNLEYLVINGKKVKTNKNPYFLLNLKNIYPFLVYATANNKFIPQNTDLMILTNVNEIKNFYAHSKEWKELIDLYLAEWKPVIVANSMDKAQINLIINDLYKISTALGFFQDGENGKNAKDFITNTILKMSPEVIHELYSALDTSANGYNEEFAKFYIKNYHGKDENGCRLLQNKELEVDIGEECETIVNYTANAYNNWHKVKEAYPNRTTLAHREHLSENNSLTEKEIINALTITEYTNVHQGNEEMARLVGKYGYYQGDFNALQEWWDESKLISEDQKILRAKKDEQKQGIVFELLSKQNPEALILGEKTNCCQVVNDVGKGCLRYGLTKSNSGFVKFSINEKLVGQSWVWYNQKTGIVCLDNIEVPTIWKKELEKKENAESFLKCLTRLANAIKDEMETNNNPVKCVTIGAGCNDLNAITKFKQIDSNHIELPDDYHGYSDAQSTQYIIPLIEKSKSTIKEDIK